MVRGFLGSPAQIQAVGELHGQARLDNGSLAFVERIGQAMKPQAVFFQVDRHIA